MKTSRFDVCEAVHGGLRRFNSLISVARKTHLSK